MQQTRNQNLANFTVQPTPNDRNVLGNLYDTMAAMIEEDENEEIPDLSQNMDTGSPHENMQDINQFVAPKIYYFKTNRAGKKGLE